MKNIDITAVPGDEICVCLSCSRIDVAKAWHDNASRCPNCQSFAVIKYDIEKIVSDLLKTKKSTDLHGTHLN